jgi:hypothetical protein
MVLHDCLALYQMHFAVNLEVIGVFVHTIKTLQALILVPDKFLFPLAGQKHDNL